MSLRSESGGSAGRFSSETSTEPQSLSVERKGLRSHQLAALRARELCAEASKLRSTSMLLVAKLSANVEKSKRLIDSAVRTYARTHRALW